MNNKNYITFPNFPLDKATLHKNYDTLVKSLILNYKSKSFLGILAMIYSQGYTGSTISSTLITFFNKLYSYSYS